MRITVGKQDPRSVVEFTIYGYPNVYKLKVIIEGRSGQYSVTYPVKDWVKYYDEDNCISYKFRMQDVQVILNTRIEQSNESYLSYFCTYSP